MNDLLSAASVVASTYLSPALLSHSHRVYVWASAYGKQHSREPSRRQRSLRAVRRTVTA